MSEKDQKVLLHETKGALLESLHTLVTAHKNSLYAKDLLDISEALLNVDSIECPCCQD